MLILTRRIGEKLVIGDNVTITMLGIKGVQIRIGIEAPASVAVHREEIYQRILKERVTDTVQAARSHTRMAASAALIAPSP